MQPEPSTNGQKVSNTTEFQSLAETAPRNQETYDDLEHPRLQELMIWMDALETEVMTITGSELGQLELSYRHHRTRQDALHPAQLARSLSRQIPMQGSIMWSRWVFRRRLSCFHAKHINSDLNVLSFSQVETSCSAVVDGRYNGCFGSPALVRPKHSGSSN